VTPIVRRLMFCPLAFVAISGSVGANPPEDLSPAADRQTVAFFETLYGVEIKGVKSLEGYDDPDAFYAAIASQVGIPEQAFKAVEKRFGWTQDEKVFLNAIVKGGGTSPEWGVMVAKLPRALTKAKTVEERQALLMSMEIKMVVIGYDGKVSFPEQDEKSRGKPEDP
jgi:hypothetical protein